MLNNFILYFCKVSCQTDFYFVSKIAYFYLTDIN